MKTFLVIATIGYMNISGIERIEMISLDECAKLREVLRLKIPTDIDHPLIRLTCVNLDIPLPKPRPKINE